jgi:hypothetical protein
LLFGRKVSRTELEKGRMGRSRRPEHDGIGEVMEAC